jgi:16S rRNA processing protein RimM
MEELVAIAKIVRPRGLRGEMVAGVLTDFPERFAELEKVVAVLPDSTRRVLIIERSWFQKNRVVLKVAGVDSIEQADELRNAELCIPESEAAVLDEDEFFDWQLEGCMVRTIQGDEIGVVREVMRTGGTENLVVASGERDVLIPFAGSICTEVDIEKKEILVDLPEGLLEF